MTRTSYDLVIVGAGSGNSIPDERYEGWRIAIVDADRFGGTCLNRGCIPTKMLVHAADLARAARTSGRLGVHSRVEQVDWPAIRDRIFGRIDPIHQSGVDYRLRTGTDVYLHEARFTGPRTLTVGDHEIEGERVVVAAGARPRVPDIIGIDGIGVHTSDTIMRVDELPDRLLVIGGGYIAVEMGHIFGSLGSRVTLVHRGDRLLEAHDHEISARFTEMFATHVDLRLDTVVERLHRAAGEHGGGEVVAELRHGDGSRSQVRADAVLAATGRIPNSDRLDVAAAGIETDEHGHIVVDPTYRTTAPGVWAFGDIANHFQLKHMANAECRVVQHNLLFPDAPRVLPSQLAPAAVFTDPQVATVGATEAQLQAQGRSFVVGRRSFGDTGFGWAMEDTTSFAKVLADPRTRLILGAHVMGPYAATLIQPLVQAMFLGNTVDQVAREVIYIHPALSEVVEQVLLEV